MRAQKTKQFVAEKPWYVLLGFAVSGLGFRVCSLALGFSSVFLRMVRDRAFRFKSSIGCSGRGLLYASSLELPGFGGFGSRGLWF